MSTPDKTSTFTSFSGRSRVQTTCNARAASPGEIPIISLVTPLEQLIPEIRDACTRVGFFYVKDHDVPQGVIDKLFNTAENFFALGRDVKDEINYKKSKILRGYEPPAEVMTDETKKADMNEAFNWGYAPELDPMADDINENWVYGQSDLGETFQLGLTD
jgi:isopenicillin N synthase-like dioxygenase